MRSRAFLAGGAAAAAGGVIALLAYTGRLGSNFREVTPGRLYRSGEMSADALGGLVRERGIRCVINLQSAPSDLQRLAAQRRACEAAGARHEQIPLSPSKLPEPFLLLKLLDRFEEGPYPMLVHCNAGADRSGLASAIYLLAVEGRPVDEAEGQLSWRYGHIPAGPLDRFFGLFRETGGGRPLREWIRDVYPDLAGE